MMKALMMIAFAYVLTGIHYVWRDLREPVWNRPAYMRGGIGAMLFGAAGWLPVTIFSAFMHGLNKRFITSWIVFVGLLVGLYIGSKL